MLPRHFDPDDHRVNLALQGGGVLGIVEVGVVAGLRAAGYEIAGVAGTSAGSMVAAMVAAGMDDADLQETVAGIDYSKFKDPVWQLRSIPVLGKVITSLPWIGQRLGDWSPVNWELRDIPVLGKVIEHIPWLGSRIAGFAPGRLAAVAWLKGSYRGDYLQQLMDTKLQGLDARTWEELDARIAEGRACPLKIVSDTPNSDDEVVMPDFYRDVLGLDPAKQPIAFAVRASTSIIAFFVPPRLRDAKGRDWSFIDGGGAEDYPYATASRINPDLETVGVMLGPPRGWQPIAAHGVGSTLSFLLRIASSGSSPTLQQLLRQPGVLRNTIIPDTLGVDPENFDITPAQVKELYDQGVKAAQAWVARDQVHRAQVRARRLHAAPRAAEGPHLAA